MAAWHYLNTDQTGMYVDPEEHIRNLLARPQHLYDRQPGESGEQMGARKLSEAMKPAGSLNTAGRPIHGAGLYESISQKGVEQPVEMFYQPGITTSPRMTNGYHRSFAAAELQRQTGQQVRLPINYIHQTPGMTSMSSSEGPASLEHDYATGKQSYEDVPEGEPSQPKQPPSRQSRLQPNRKR